MLTKEVFFVKYSRNGLRLRVGPDRLQGHRGNFFHNNGIVGCFGG